MINSIIDTTNDQMYPYEFMVYIHLSFVIEWLDDFFRAHPLDVLVTIQEPEYIDVNVLTSNSTQRIKTKEGYIRAQFRHETDAIAFKLKFGL